MQTPIGQLTFCSNIFPGETWEEHFQSLKKYIPVIKGRLSPGNPFGLGLRLSNKATLQLSKQEVMEAFQDWLGAQDCYVFTMNGFPFGNFHHGHVKDQVHVPDWTSNERMQYTLRMFRILAALLPEGLEGGVSTSPISYKPWYGTDQQLAAATEQGTWNIVQTISQLYQLRMSTGKLLHLDIEPEPNGLLENWKEFLHWYQQHLIPGGTLILRERFGITESEAEDAIRDHLRLCYDVCHFAVAFEDMEEVLRELTASGIRIGKWQLSAALKATFSRDPEENQGILNELKKFDEPVYLHQVVKKKENGLVQYPDLPPALQEENASPSEEWRSHFHVPLFMKRYGLLQSTQGEVTEALRLQALHHYALHLEVETYTWEVLPEDAKAPVDESIIREMEWVLAQIT